MWNIFILVSWEDSRPPVFNPPGGIINTWSRSLHSASPGGGGGNQMASLLQIRGAIASEN